jgi:hypothetical protein
MVNYIFILGNSCTCPASSILSTNLPSTGASNNINTISCVACPTVNDLFLF